MAAATAGGGAHRGSPALLPWTAAAEHLVQPTVQPPAAAPPPQLSLVDRLAAPAAFLHQALVFDRALDARALRAALAVVLALMPTLACRATKDVDGEWTLCQPGAGAPLTLGTSSTAAAEVAPRPVPPLAPMVDLGRELFGHLPSSMPGDATEAAALPLFHVSLVAVEGGGSGERSRERSGGKGGCVLGLRISHMVADYSTLRCALHHLARAYSGRPLAAFDVPAPAVPLVATLAARPPPLGAQPYNYLPLPPDVGAQFAALAAAPPLQGLVLHVPPARLAELKAQALAEAAAAAAGAAGLGMGTEAAAAAVDTGGGEGGDATGGEGNEPDWVSTDDALMAWLWRTLAALPCRRGAVTPFNRGLNMRGRLPAAAYEGGHQPRWIYGNLATSSFTPALDAPALSLGQVALELRRTVARDAAKFQADLALAAEGERAGARCSSKAILPLLEIMRAVAEGRRPLYMATQLQLDYADDVSFGGQLPVGAVCSFGAPLIPLVAVQPAPPAAGGGTFLYLWLRPDEARELEAALKAEQAEQAQRPD